MGVHPFLRMIFQNERIIGIFQILLGASLFGLIPIFIRYGQAISTSHLVFFRAFFGMIFIYVIIKLSKRNITPFKEEKLKLIIWAVILLLAIGSYFHALKSIDISSAVLLLYSQSIFIVLFSKFWLKEKIRLFTMVSLLLSILGVVLILSPSGFNFQGNALGYLFAISAAFWAGLNFMFPKKYFKDYDPHSLTFYQNLWQLPILFVFVLMDVPIFTTVNLGIFAGLGLFCTALAFLFIYTGSRKVPGQYIGILQTSEAIVPIVLGIMLFSEIPSFVVVLGGLFLVSGYIVIALKESKD